MTVSRVWLVIGMLAPALAAAQPGPDDSQPNRAPPPVDAPAPAPVYAPAPRPSAPPPQPGSYAGPPGEYRRSAPWSPAPPVALTAAPPANPAGRKSPATAGWTSGLVTAGGLALMIVAAGMESNDSYDRNGYYQGSNNNGRDLLATVGAIAFVVGPTTGHIYAGHTWNTGLGIRLASVAAMTVGIGQAIASDNNGSSGNNSGEAIFILGAIGYGVGTIAEIGLAPGAAHDYNRAHGLDLQLSVIPVRDTRHATTPGIGLVGRF